jgi:uncharacterized Rossmann fold enzyme
LPAAAVRLPARDMGWPYLARFSAVSGTGPLVTSVVVTLTFEPVLVAEVAVELLTLVEVEVEVSLDDADDWVSLEVDAAGVSVVVEVVVELCCA